MFIIAGLGNPDEKYQGTRHNVGFDVVDRLAFIPLLLHSEMKIWNWKFLSLTPLSIPSAFPI